MLEKVWELIDREEPVRLARELVRIPSVYRPEDPAGNEEAAARFVAEYLEGAGFEVRTEEVAPGRPNVWAVWEGDLPGKTLLFEAHTDVVTEGVAEDWEHPPFAAEREGGRLYGRGSCDTKGNLAAAVVAVRAIKDSGVSFPGRLVLCHPVDEEGMMAGIKAFVEGGHASGVDAAVICEPEENQLCVRQKGALRVEVTVRGRMAHGAMPLSGVNPVTRAARFVVAVEELEREEIGRCGEDPFVGYPSLTPTILMGPEFGEPQINVVPASAYVALDIRTTPAQSHGELVGKLEGILKRLADEDPDFDATLEVIEERPPTETPKDEPLVRATAAAYRRLTGAEPRYNGVPGATDGTFLHAWAGIPIITTGAGDREIPHHKDEWVDEEELFTACKLYAATAMYYAYGED
ncbi:ArgE/DapE family deacylase [Rubrobacter tropicus]|uniref:Probable succinyl-diaminopimelate desuccinylase n=1 Tax=Rubrobacter tropicus TaxID=2653851 RepID=A0A6G8QES8_9ACTN|nr:ArgE/DapE family deacylase [Rubrobacter tropicus]